MMKKDTINFKLVFCKPCSDCTVSPWTKLKGYLKKNPNSELSMFRDVNTDNFILK